MFIKSLIIKRDEELIREIHFHKGINLIVDETLSKDRTKSGNNVGKTTVLRLVDFCLGGKGENIYKDPEFRTKSNSQIETILKESNINITLVLVEDIELESSPEITVRRNFLNRKDRILEINGEKQKRRDYSRKLKKLIFRNDGDKPTLRQLIAKNIRDEKNRLINPLKVLSPFTTIKEYEALHLFWLGIDLETNAREQKLRRNLNVEKGLIKRLEKSATYSQIQQSLSIRFRTIEQLTEKKNQLGIADNHADLLAELSQVKAKINLVSNEITNLELRRNLIQESKKELECEYSTVDTEHIRSIYQEAKALIPQLQKSFEETLDFHNRMIKNKLDYITAEMPQLTQELSSQRRTLDQLLNRETKLSNQVRKSSFQSIIEELNNAHETKGSLEEQKRLWDHAYQHIEAIQSELEQIETMIQNQIAEFNRFFSEISYKLYGERFVLSSDKHDRGYQLEISSISGNLGTGKKKGQIAAFDLAYIQFADAQGIECLHFVMQDQIENVHDNQLTSILTEVVAQTNCQYILPVLRDKLPEDMDVDQFIALRLSQGDKLFRV